MGVPRSAATALLLMLAACAALPAAATPPTSDFVIVGGGTAGCTLAARLCTALPRARVVLLERGAPRNGTEEFLVRAARLTTATWPEPTLSEIILSAPARGLGGRTVRLLAGTTLGGSSAINFGQWTTPPAAEVAAWGVTGLTASTAGAYYARAAAALGVAVPPPPLRQVYTEEWLDAAGAAGLPRVDEAAPGPTPRRGAWIHRIAVDPAGRRVDACAGYVAPALAGACADNLELVQGVTVTKVLLETRRGRRHGGGRHQPVAVGVQYVASADRAAGRAAATTTLRARRAVISAAGPYGSPKLLLLSGIGPPAALRAAGVTPTVTLPAVGARMQTRPFAQATATYSGVPLAPANNATLLADPATVEQWRAGRGGVLGVAAAAALGRQTDGLGTYIEAMFTPWRSAPGRREYVSTCLSNPSATGRLTLDGADPFAQPVVQTNLLGGGAAEVSTVVACLRRLRAITRSFPPAWGMREVEPPASRRIDEALVRATTVSGQHMVGGCAVGAVLDGRLRVRGVARLHVVDASAIPSMTSSAGPMASVYMLAEWAADRLAARYGAGLRGTAG